MAFWCYSTGRSLRSNGKQAALNVKAGKQIELVELKEAFMNFFNTATRSETVKLSVVTAGAWVAFLLMVVVSFGCAPTKMVSLKAPVATTQTVEDDEGVVLLGALPQPSQAEKGGFQKASLTPAPRFGAVSVTITDECSVRWEVKGSEDSLTINGRVDELFSPGPELKFLSKEYFEKNIFSETRVSVRVGARNRLEVVEVTPAGLELTFPTKNKAPAGHTYTGKVQVVSLGNQQKFFLTLAETDKGIDAQCVATPGF